MNLKLLTLNLHCFAESNVKEKQEIITKEIIKRDIDIVFLQEVAQLETEENMIKPMISEDNYGKSLQNLLKLGGKEYYFYYEPIKRGFNIYQEGIGILSKFPLHSRYVKYISKTREYENWKSRKILAYNLKLDHMEIRLATTHFGWSDGYELFEDQFDHAVEDFDASNLVIFAGDFNIKSDSFEYAHIVNKGWYDLLANHPEDTFSGDVQNETAARIDYYMTNRPVKLLNYAILFKNERVSDHFGVYAEIELI